MNIPKIEILSLIFSYLLVNMFFGGVNMKKITVCLLAFLMLPTFAFAQPELGISAKSAILMELSTGQVMYEQNADEPLPIASVTKIMTMLLACEAIDSGKIKLDDGVVVSERAMSMGGSTMFLETGDVVSVDEIMKGIAVASANDGAVAIAEHIAGSEMEFVRLMNERAKELGMINSAFVNTNGLDADGHYSSARDVAIMSRELLKHKLIFNYTKIWTDTIRNGRFELANTNKLIRFYKGANGLKTGSTSLAKCCLSASAERDGMQLIAVVLGAPDSNARFNGAKAMLDYGFSAYSVREIVPRGTELARVKVSGGLSKDAGCEIKKTESVLLDKSDSSEFEYTVEPLPELTAPIYKGDEVGEVVITKNGEEFKRIPAYANGEVGKKTFFLSFLEVLGCLYS